MHQFGVRANDAMGWSGKSRDKRISRHIWTPGGELTYEDWIIEI